MRRTVRRPGLVLLALLLPLAAGCGSTAEPDGPLPSTSGADGQAVTAGTPGSERAVVLAHGAAYDAASWTEQAEVLAADGAYVVALEDVSPAAVADAAEQVRADGADDVALGGGSVGADAVLEAVAADPQLADRVSLLSPNSPVEDLGGVPTTVVASEDEAVADVGGRLADAAPGSTTVELLPGSAHAQALLTSAQAERATDLFLAGLTGR